MSESYSNRQAIVYGPRNERSYIGSPAQTSKTTQQPRLDSLTTRNSNNLAGYSTYIKLGKPLPWTVFTFNKTTRLYPTGSEFTNNGGARFSLEGCLNSSSNDPLMPASTLIDPNIITRTEARARQQLLTNIKAQKVNMGTFLAESGKSMKMIGDAATKIYGALSNLRKGNLVAAAQHLGIATSRRRQRRFNRTARNDQSKAIASAWLEMQYGWKPLLMDTYNAAQEIADNVSPIFIGHAFGKHVETWSNASSYVVNNYDYPGSNIDRGVGRCEVRYKCTFSMENTVARRAALNGLSNPLMVAWELVPYSFVVDWFLPIGDYLSNIDATNGLAFHSGGVISYYKHTASRERVINHPRMVRTSNQGYSDLRISRGALGSFPGNTFPEFRNPLTLGHTINAVALLLNLRK